MTNEEFLSIQRLNDAIHQKEFKEELFWLIFCFKSPNQYEYLSVCNEKTKKLYGVGISLYNSVWPLKQPIETYKITSIIKHRGERTNKYPYLKDSVKKIRVNNNLNSAIKGILKEIDGILSLAALGSI